MAFDLSSLQNIDFTNTDTLIFLSIVFIIALIVFLSFIIVIKKIIKIIKRLIITAFNIDIKRPKFDKKDIGRSVSDDNKINTNAASQSSIQKDYTEKIAGPTRQANRLGYAAGEIKIPMPASTAQHFPPTPAPEEVNMDRSVLGENTIPIKKSPAPKGGKGSDSSILFEGRHDVLKRELEHEMRYNPKIWQAAKDSMLYLNREERAKLVKETFSSAYGRNISKSDLKWGIRKLNQKMLGTKDPVQHAKIRKEIKFFKKIGGI